VCDVVGDPVKKVIAILKKLPKRGKNDLPMGIDLSVTAVHEKKIGDESTNKIANGKRFVVEKLRMLRESDGLPHQANSK
jgi:hypothetical protein